MKVCGFPPFNPVECARFVEEAVTLGFSIRISSPFRGDPARWLSFFTMKVVKGEACKVIRHVHQYANTFRFEPTVDGWTFRRLIDVFHQVCQAVAFAHSKGVLHRDLKPQNIMLGEFGRS